MTKTEANTFRRTLESRQSELGKGTSNCEGLEIASSPDELDRIQEAMERDYRMGNIERSSNLLREVRGALRRIDTDAFGICASYHEDINQKRLAASRGPPCVSSAKRPRIGSSNWRGARSTQRS